MDGNEIKRIEKEFTTIEECCVFCGKKMDDESVHFGGGNYAHKKCSKIHEHISVMGEGYGC